MKNIYLIGIGPGNKDYLTIQAIETIKKVDVFLLLEKGERKDTDLLGLRKEILENHLKPGAYRVVTKRMPVRKRGRPAYHEEVAKWRGEVADTIGEFIENDLRDGQNGGILVWGDPALYDGHLEMLRELSRKIRFSYEAVPGISSIQVLAARHKIPLNRISEPILITTARHLKEYDPAEIKNMIVVLDSHASFKNIDDDDIDIYWGGYLGSEDEILLSGRLKDIKEEIKKAIMEAKRRKGWIMDSYILRRRMNE
ncbi:MAG: precorrin-6A synthase (deacetylating) [Nitrospirae bacterium]|nr:MAG: precorrin-6A synthase (deacetylating) [Nitrospirota bacterium]